MQPCGIILCGLSKADRTTVPTMLMSGAQSQDPLTHYWIKAIYPCAPYLDYTHLSTSFLKHLKIKV